eukprot:scaffold51948_cov65-Phaeocystis_antarctica.AAC.1
MACITTCVQESSADEDQPDGAALAVFLVSFREQARQPTSDTWLDAIRHVRHGGVAVVAVVRRHGGVGG